MEIKDILEHMEGTIIADLDRMTPKDRVTMYANLKEFELAKLQRQAHRQNTDADTEFTITIVNNES